MKSRIDMEAKNRRPKIQKGFHNLDLNHIISLWTSLFMWFVMTFPKYFCAPDRTVFQCRLYPDAKWWWYVFISEWNFASRMFILQFVLSSFQLVSIKQIQELLRGQKTKVFHENPIPEYEVLQRNYMFIMFWVQFQRVNNTGLAAQALYTLTWCFCQRILA